jgi:uncharacterized protein
MIDEIIKNYEIIDTHLHLGELAYFNTIADTDKQIIDILKRLRVKKAIFSHSGSLATFDFGFKKTINILNKYEKFLYAYLVFNPNLYKESLDLLKKNIKKDGLVGVKIHPSWHKTYPHDERYRLFWEHANRNNLVILTHSWNPDVANKDQKYSDPFLFEKILKKYKNIKLILAHAGGRGNYLFKTIELLKKFSNLYVDFAGDIFVPNLLEHYVGKVGSERILFGTDMPWSDIRYHIIRVVDSDISEEDKINIFINNATKLFNF